MCEITCLLYSECWHHKRVLVLCSKQEQKQLKKYVESQHQSQTSKRSFFSALFSSTSLPPPHPVLRPSTRFSCTSPKPPKTVIQHSCRASKTTYKTITTLTACPDCVDGRTSCRISGPGSKPASRPVPSSRPVASGPVPSRLPSRPPLRDADCSMSGLVHSSKRLGEDRGRSQQPPKLPPTRGNALPRFLAGAHHSPAVYGHAPPVPSPLKCSIDRINSAYPRLSRAERRSVVVQQRPPQPASGPANSTGPGSCIIGMSPRQQQQQQQQIKYTARHMLPSQRQCQPLSSAPSLSFPSSSSSQPEVYRRPAVRVESTARNGRGRNISIRPEAVAMALPPPYPVGPPGSLYYPPPSSRRSDSVYSKVSEQSTWETEGRPTGNPRSVSPPGQSRYERWMSDRPALEGRNCNDQNTYGCSPYSRRQ